MESNEVKEGVFYALRGLGPAFDELDVKVTTQIVPDGRLGPPLFKVDTIRRRSTMIGDRPWSVPVGGAPGIWVGAQHLEPSPVSGQMEFSFSSPYGEHLRSEAISTDGTEVVVSTYSDAYVVSVREIVTRKTLFTQTFSGEQGRHAADCFRLLQENQYDVDDFIMEVKSLTPGIR